jgi:hypothetical protein
MLYQPVVVPRFGTRKGIKGKGHSNASLSHAHDWIELMDSMSALVDETKTVYPRYFYLEVRIRRDSSYVGLRWRGVGRNGSTLTFGDVRFQHTLSQLPVVVQRLYREWEQRRVVLNQCAVDLRRASMRQHSQPELNQFLLRW